MSELDDLDDQPETADLRAEGVAASRSPRTLLSGIALFAPTAYASAVVLRDSPHATATRVAICAIAVGLVARGAPALDELPSDGRGAARVAVGCARVGASLAAGLPLQRPETPMLARLAIVAASALAVASAVRSAASITGLGGVGALPAEPIARQARRVALAWLLAGATLLISLLPIVHGLVALAITIRIPLVATVAVGSVIQLVAAGRLRRHELGARERHELLLGAATLALPASVMIATGLQPFAMRPRIETLIVVPALSIVAAVLFAQIVNDPVRAALRVGRAWVILTATCVAGFAVLIASPSSIGVALVLGVVIGLCTDFLSRVLGVEGPRVVAVREAVKRAREAATTNDPNEVARGVLASLRTLVDGERGGDSHATPRMLLFSPLREVVLDAAGEPRTRDPVPHAEPIPDPDAPSPLSRVVPAELLKLAASEPLGVVRTSVLRALEVRRPDLRAALRFCEQRGVAAVVSVVVDGELDGLLMLPSAAIAHDLGLPAVRALRTIARLSATRLSLEAALARAAARAQRAELRAREVEHVVERAHHREDRLANAIAAASRPFERGVAIAGYAPASRALLSELEALARTPAHLVMLHRPGTDPIPWIARLHRESGRAGALHVVDAGRPDTPWSDPVASPIELARDGTLCVLSAHALPRDAQKRLLAALSFREGPGADPSPVDLRIVLAVASTDPENDELDRLRALDAALLAHLREAPLRIVALARRSEDLHAIALDRLASVGIALRGEPLGIAPAALALLVEHPWTGDDLELDDVLLRAAMHASGKRVEASELRAVLSATPATDPDGSKPGARLP